MSLPERELKPMQSSRLERFLIPGRFSMPDNPLSIRVTDETRALFNDLAENSGIENKGDFLNRLLTLFQAEKMKETESTLGPAIEATAILTNRLLEVLTGAGAILMTKEEQQKQALEEQRASFEETRALLQQRIFLLEQERIESEERSASLISDKEAADKKATELQMQIERLERAAADKDALIVEYKDKIDILSGVVSEHIAVVTENKNFQEAVNNAKQENERQQRQIDELTREIKRQAEASKATEESLMSSLLLQKDSALLALRQELQLKHEEEQAKHAAAISEYENKVRDLLGLSGRQNPV